MDTVRPPIGVRIYEDWDKLDVEGLDQTDLLIIDGCHGGIDKEGIAILRNIIHRSPNVYLQMRVGAEGNVEMPWGDIELETWDWGDSPEDTFFTSRTLKLRDRLGYRQRHAGDGIQNTVKWARKS